MSVDHGQEKGDHGHNTVMKHNPSKLAMYAVHTSRLHAHQVREREKRDASKHINASMVAEVYYLL